MKNLLLFIIGVAMIVLSTALPLLLIFSSEPVRDVAKSVIIIITVLGYFSGIFMLYIWYWERKYSRIKITEDPDKAFNEVVNSQYDW